MDESSLEETISDYKTQLSQIQTLLASADELTKLELYDLEKDLMEMIKIAEESLLETKKKNLLATLEGNDASSSTVTDKSTLTYNTVKTEVDVKADDTNDGGQIDFVGMKCRVKYTQEWGGFQYHNAIILNCEVDDTLDDCQVKAHLLFLNPIHTSMVPCKYFLNGRCDYDATCKFSHGYVVDIEELEEYDEPDFSQLRKGGKCLAKYESDGVWYPATITSIHEEQATVSYDKYDDEIVTLDFHSILPQLSYYSESSSEDDTEDFSNTDIMDLSYKPVSMSGPMGEWEEHTKGIGSKLMKQMGYIFGKGLGKNNDGKIEPVEIRLLPPGKSLDHIAELREKGKIKDPLKRKNKNIKSKDSLDNPESAFDVINRLTHTTRGGGTSNEIHATSSKFSIEDSYKSMKKHLKNRNVGDAKIRRKNKDSKLNIEMFKVSEKISGLKKQLSSQKEALSRNPGDTSVSRRIQQNIDATQDEIDELKNIDRSLQQKIQMKNQSKKLTVF